MLVCSRLGFLVKFALEPTEGGCSVVNERFSWIAVFYVETVYLKFVVVEQSSLERTPVSIDKLI